MGIDQPGCEAKNCCWVPSKPEVYDSNSTGVPWCFHPSATPTPPTTAPPPSPGPAPTPNVDRTAFVHLFEWSWKDIAQECEEFLGPMGFAAVQTSPQMEHITGDAWWTRYQPVSRQTVSRSGDESAFRDMVKRCNAVGVGIYADPVPNHMAAGGGTGTAGSSYGGRNYPNLSPNDFHHNDGDTSSNCQVSNYNDKFNVQHCDLVGLPDIDTGSDFAQQELADYFNNLASMGVAGFRIDAAKHQDDGEIAAYVGKAGNPYVFQEVIYGDNEAVQPEQYTHIGQVTEFRYGQQVGHAFQGGDLGSLSSLGQGMLGSGSAVTFIDNHDTQRGGAVITYNDGDTYKLANFFMLAHPYGYPKIMSSYYFSGHDQGPPGSPVHGGSLNCFQGHDWVCEHRWAGVGEMVGFRNIAGGATVNNWQADGNKLAFGRGGRAFVAINLDGNVWSATLSTGMPAGKYCNIIVGLSPCAVVEVDSSGSISANVPARSAVAFHLGATP